MPRDPAARLALARTDAASGFDQRAWRGFRSALAAEPEGPLRLAVLVELADAAAQRGDALAASFFAEQARYLGPDHPAVDLVTARIAQRFAPGSPAVAAAWQRVLDRDGANVEALVARGVAHLAAGQAVDALALLQTASGLDPRNPEILYQRARALAAAARYQEAHGLLIECARLTARPGGDMGLFDRAVRLAQSMQARLVEGGNGGS
ncbi:MAG: tetratricopeptide repeat protein [Planctomycetota bacterium]